MSRNKAAPPTVSGAGSPERACTDAPGKDPFETPPRTAYRWAWWLLAYFSLGLGLVGIVLPGLPTAPFVLLAAFAAVRGSARLHRYLLTHPQFGSLIRNWQAHGAVSLRIKRMAILAMAVSAVLQLALLPQTWMALPGIAGMGVVAIWLWLRPEPPDEPRNG